jgi:uncharacterized protein YbaP (TraB family)
MSFRRIAALLFTLFLTLPVAADPITEAHPALWHVQGPRGDAYMLGAVHILPTALDWRTPQIQAAIAKSDTFVFEILKTPDSLARLQQVVEARGRMPAGTTLRALLSPEALKDYEGVLADLGLPADAMDGLRPWIADLELTLLEAKKQKYDSAGVDDAVMAQAQAAGKPMRAFETVEQQIALVAPDDEQAALENFEADLKDLKNPEDEIAGLYEAWASGDPARLDRFLRQEYADQPAVRERLLDARNRAWIPQIEAMLREKHSYFIAVGAGHLAGPAGVPALLRAAGYKVDGP